MTNLWLMQDARTALVNAQTREIWRPPKCVHGYLTADDAKCELHLKGTRSFFALHLPLPLRVAVPVFECQTHAPKPQTLNFGVDASCVPQRKYHITQLNGRCQVFIGVGRLLHDALMHRVTCRRVAPRLGSNCFALVRLCPAGAASK